MLNQQTAVQFVQGIQQHAPFINSVQLMTVDGLSLHCNTDKQDDDAVSALSAMLYSAAARLANNLEAVSPQGLIMCMGEFAYAVTRVNDDCFIGFQMPADRGNQASLQSICTYIDHHQHGLQMIH